MHAPWLRHSELLRSVRRRALLLLPVLLLGLAFLLLGTLVARGAATWDGGGRNASLSSVATGKQGNGAMQFDGDEILSEAVAQ